MWAYFYLIRNQSARLGGWHFFAVPAETLDVEKMICMSQVEKQLMEWKIVGHLLVKRLTHSKFRICLLIQFAIQKKSSNFPPKCKQLGSKGF